MDYKQCVKCGQYKRKSDFYKDMRNKDGLRGRCKSCYAVDCATYYAENKEIAKATKNNWRAKNIGKVKARESAYRIENPEKSRAASVKWAIENPEKAKIAKAAYRAANKEKIKNLIKRWFEKNPEVRRIYAQNRDAKMRSNGGSLSKGLAQKLFKLQKGKCACCGKPLGDNYHLDHIMPIALGGANEDWNIQLLRQRCNNQKSAKHPVDFMQSRGFLL